MLTEVLPMGYIAVMAKKTMPSFGARLRELREHAGLTQAQLAERAGLHLSAVTRYEHGRREPTLATASLLATALGVPVDELLKPGAAEAPRPRGRPRKSSGEGAEPPPKKPGKRPKK
jgi:transcriptional regulator with XRE-family HTH domain